MLATNQTAIVDTKNNTSERLTIPFAIPLNRVRKLKLEMASSNQRGTQDSNTFSTNGKPDMTNNKQTTPLKRNATTWLLLSADIQDPMARKAPAISQLPKYPANITPLSGSPR